MRQDITKMTVTTRKVIRVGETSFLVRTDVGLSGSLIVTREMIVRSDNEIDLHAWGSE